MSEYRVFYQVAVFCLLFQIQAIDILEEESALVVVELDEITNALLSGIRHIEMTWFVVGIAPKEHVGDGILVEHRHKYLCPPVFHSQTIHTRLTQCRHHIMLLGNLADSLKTEV